MLTRVDLTQNRRLLARDQIGDRHQPGAVDIAAWVVGEEIEHGRDVQLGETALDGRPDSLSSTDTGSSASVREPAPVQPDRLVLVTGVDGHSMENRYG